MSRLTAIGLVAFFFLGLLTPFVWDASVYPKVVAEVPTSVGGALDGTVQARFEEVLAERSPFMRALRPWWNGAVYDLFAETPARLVAGRDGWLFYAPSMAPVVEPLASQTFQETLAQLLRTAVTLKGSPVRYRVLVMPSKWRLYGDRLLRPRIGEKRRDVLARAVGALAAAGIDAPELLPSMRRLKSAERPLLYPPVDSHLSQFGFGRLVTDAVAPAVGIDVNEARRRLATLPTDPDFLHVGDLVELMGLDLTTPWGRRLAYREKGFKLPPPANRAGSDVILLGDSFTVHMDALLPRLIQAVTGLSVDARYSDGKEQGHEDELFAEYAGRAPKLVLVVLTERRFANE
ncbi:MAG TPA: hypothetical protein ENK43_15310 [Planctomycetes bacterium]|nr:hypothetical protein [Planctomycetota bacterium]